MITHSDLKAFAEEIPRALQELHGHTYQPETITLPKDTILLAIVALESGLDHARSALIEHDSSNGRTTRKNQTWAEQIEADIAQLVMALEAMRCRD